MSETAKTVTFVAVAVAVALVTWATRPTLPVASPNDVRGQALYPDFKDPLAVTSLTIVKFDEKTATVQPFEVAQIDVKGKLVWRIPSHDDYPADAKDQVASAAASLRGLTILEQVSDNQGDQQEFGVVDPDPKTLKLGDTGVGTRVVMKDKDGKELLAVVIGKAVPDRPGLYYLRKVNQAPIYVVEVKTDKLSTKFENWIERNLLGINTLDMKQIWIQDYSVDKFQGALLQRGEMVLGYNDTGEPKWNLIEDRKLVPDAKSPLGGRFVPVKLAADEELNTAQLDALKNALDDLKIVDVSRKPAGLSADLKTAADFMNNPEAVQSLGRCGFTVADVDGQMGLYSNDGEIRVLMKDGVQYVLRFGAVTGDSSAPTKEAAEPDSAAGEKKPEGPQMNRYLFVMAEFDPAAIPKPQLEPLPEPKPDEAKPDAAAKPTDDKKTADGKSAAKPEETERQRIEKENKRKQDEYEQKIADGQKKVSELNARFADWYYIIADDVYRKIHLGRDELIKKKGPPKTGDAKGGAPAQPAGAMFEQPTPDEAMPPVTEDDNANPAETKPEEAKQPEPAKTEAAKPVATKPAEAKDAAATPAAE